MRLMQLISRSLKNAQSRGKLRRLLHLTLINIGHSASTASPAGGQLVGASNKPQAAQLRLIKVSPGFVLKRMPPWELA